MNTTLNETAGAAVPAKKSLPRRLLPTLLTIILLAVCLKLGFWQLQRSDFKLQIRNVIAEREAMDYQLLTNELVFASSYEHFKVKVTGRYDTRREFLLDNQVVNGQVGFNVITPLQIGDSETRVLVNRGWVPATGDRSVRPGYATPAGEFELQGRASVPSSSYFTLQNEQEKAVWNPVWQHLDITRLKRFVDFPLQPIVILLDEDSDAGGFLRKWPDFKDSWVERHNGYAFQWFALAATLLYLYGYFTFFKRVQTGNKPE